MVTDGPPCKCTSWWQIFASAWDGSTRDMTGHIESEHVILEMIYKFSSHLACNCVWSHAHFFWCFPSAALQNRTEREHALKDLRQIVTAVIQAGEVPNPSGDLQNCLKDLAWNQEQLPRILMRHAWATQFDPNCAEIRNFLASMYGGTSSTKEVLESCINYINRQIAFATTNKVATHSTKWVLATLNPLLKGPEATQRQFLPLDFTQATRSPTGCKAVSEDLSCCFDISRIPPSPNARITFHLTKGMMMIQ